MSAGKDDSDRRRRVKRLRDDWRKRPHASDEPAEPGTGEASEQGEEALASNDQIRAEAPEDLETRRRADQLEREIRRTERHD